MTPPTVKTTMRLDCDTASRSDPVPESLASFCSQPSINPGNAAPFIQSGSFLLEIRHLVDRTCAPALCIAAETLGAGEGKLLAGNSVEQEREDG